MVTIFVKQSMLPIYFDHVGLSDNKTVTIPFEPNIHLTLMDDTLLFDPTRYRQLVGSLVYLTVTHHDITYIFHLVSQFMCASRTTHFIAILQIQQYLKGILFHGFNFSSHSKLELIGYSDVIWIGDPTD